MEHHFKIEQIIISFYGVYTHSCFGFHLYLSRYRVFFGLDSCMDHRKNKTNFTLLLFIVGNSIMQPLR